MAYTETYEERSDWINTIRERKAQGVDDNAINIEIELNQELLAKHPLILDVLLHLGNFWDLHDYTEEALILFIQGEARDGGIALM